MGIHLPLIGDGKLIDRHSVLALADSSGLRRRVEPIKLGVTMKQSEIRILASPPEELEIDIAGAASTTFQREDLAQGFEPLACFYVQDASRIRGHKQIDLRVDPPPELVIEIDISHASLNKFPIFAGLGIPEVWRYPKQTLNILRLAGETYLPQESSDVFPGASGEDLTRLIADGQKMKRTEWIRSVREWALTLKKKA